MAEIRCKECGKKCKSLQGWKMHMSNAHGGYTDATLRETFGAIPSSDVKSRMENFASNLPGEDGKISDVTPIDSSPQFSQPPEPAKRIKATPKKIKKLLGDIPGKILEAQGIPLDQDDRDALEEAAEFMAGIFGVEFAIPTSSYVIESRFFAILWVVGITLLVFVKHRAPDIWKMFSSENPKQKPDARKENKTEQSKPNVE